MRFFSWVSDGLKNWSWLIRRQASQCLESVCVNAAENTRTQPDTPLKPKDRCSDTHQRESPPHHILGLVSALCVGLLSETVRGGWELCRCSNRPWRWAERWKLKERTKAWKGKDEAPVRPPHWITRLVLTFRLHQLLYNILLALVKRELAWEVEAFFALYFDWLLVRVWMKEEGGQWKGKNKNRMGFNEGSWHSCSKTTQNQMKCKLTMHIK